MTDEKVVYVLEHELGPVKIGRSHSPKARCKDLQSGCPFEISVLGVIEADDSAAAEASLHRRYEDQNIRGEWFNLSDRQLLALRGMMDAEKGSLNPYLFETSEERREATLRWQGLVG